LTKDQLHLVLRWFLDGTRVQQVAERVNSLFKTAAGPSAGRRTIAYAE
jgi:hypothetical protein